MSGNKKVTIKSLSDELAIVKEDLKEMHILREKVKELEKEIVTLKKGEANHKEADQDSHIESASLLKIHTTNKQA